MASVADTAEGSGESFLKQWLKENRLSKLENKLLAEAEINAEELLDFALNTNEAIQFCKDFKVSGLLQKRFIKALQTFPARYGQQNNTDNNGINDDNTMPKLIVATLSKEEEEIINKVNTQRKINKMLNEKIDTLIESVADKEKLCYNEINSVFSELQQALDAHRSELRAELQHICAEKKNTLLSAKQKITECNNKIKRFQSKNTELLMNWQMDKSDRKEQIVANGNDIVNHQSFPTNPASQTMLDQNITISLKVNKDAAIKFISEVGIIDIGTPNPPKITMNEILTDNIKITADYGEVSEVIKTLQVELCEGDGNFDDDVKLQWEENIFQVNNINESYTIQNIKSGAKYGLRAKVKNANGWSGYCNVNIFNTIKKGVTFATYNNTHWVVSNNGKTMKKGAGTNCYPSAVYSETGYKHGVHLWTVKAVKRTNCCEHIGITSGERNTSSVSGTLYYLYSFGGHAYHQKYPWTADGDVATVKLDCNNWKVTISSKNKGQWKEENIEPNQTYYFAMNGCGTGNPHYEIVQQ